MHVPPARYAHRDGASLAFQVDGDGPDLVVVAGAASTTTMWDDPDGRSFLDALRDGTRLVTFDQRGAGRSDPLLSSQLPVLEERVADALAVIEAAEADRPYLLAFHDGGPVALLAVASQPELFRGLILVNTPPRMSWAPDYPQGFDQASQDWFLDNLPSRWGTGFTLELWAPSWSRDPDGRARWARVEQTACSPSQAVLQTRQTFATDARHLLELVSVPTLVVQRRDDPAVPAGNGRYLADRIRGCTLLELPGVDHMPFSGDAGQIIGAIRSFLAVDRKPEPDPRHLAAVVFTDIVGSTEMLSRLGDEKWVALLDAHDAAARTRADELDGRLVKTTGDGTLTVFDGPARAVEYAVALLRDVNRLGLQMRAGVHAGEVHARGDDVAGLAVHAAARVASLAPPDAVYVSRSVTDLVVGAADLTFEPRGEHALKGLDGMWELFRAEPAGH